VGASPREQVLTDDQAFERHVLPEVEVMLRVAMSLTRNAADAEDLVQDTMIRAYRAIGRFDGRHPRAWLLTILRNTNINRHRRRRPAPIRDADAAARLLEGEAPHPSAEDVVIGATFDATVRSALDHLPYRFRRVVELVDIAGLGYQETAHVLGIPVGTVMSRLHRARRRIRTRLAAAGLVPGKHR
jgi:RNA polymerase sigma-70 factor (ECF subfamily)